MIDELEFSQMGRFFYWTPRNAALALPTATLISPLAQMHMIPATKPIEAKLRQLRPGQLVTASGYLVDVRGANGLARNTSLSRTDSGDGASELFWVERLETD